MCLLYFHEENICLNEMHNNLSFYIELIFSFKPKISFLPYFFDFFHTWDEALTFFSLWPSGGGTRNSKTKIWEAGHDRVEFQLSWLSIELKLSSIELTWSSIELKLSSLEL